MCRLSLTFLMLFITRRRDELAMSTHQSSSSSSSFSFSFYFFIIGIHKPIFVCMRSCRNVGRAA